MKPSEVINKTNMGEYEIKRSFIKMSEPCNCNFMLKRNEEGKTIKIHEQTCAMLGYLQPKDTIDSAVLSLFPTKQDLINSLWLKCAITVNYLQKILFQ